MGKSHLRSALVLGAIAALLVAAVPANAQPEHPVGLERAAQVHERNEDRREDKHEDKHEDRDDHKLPVIVHPQPQPPTVIIVHDPAPPAPAPIVITVPVPVDNDDGPASTPAADPPSTSSSSASSSSGAGGGSGGISDEAGRLAACHYEPATAPKLQGGAVVPGTPAGFQLRWLFRFQLDNYVNASSPDYLSQTGDCGPGSNPAIV